MITEEDKADLRALIEGITGEGDLDLSDISFMDIYEKASELFQRHPALKPVLVIALDAIAVYIVMKIPINQPSPEAIRARMLNALLTANTMYMGAWILSNAESEAAESVALGLMGYPIIGASIEAYLNWQNMSRRERGIAIRSIGMISGGLWGMITAGQTWDFWVWWGENAPGIDELLNLAGWPTAY